MSAKTFSVKAEVGISIADQTIDDIMETAHYGISYWCSAIDVVGKQLGEYPYEQISRGGSLILYDAETSDKWELTREKFLSGIKLWLEQNEGIHAVID